MQSICHEIKCRRSLIKNIREKMLVMSYVEFELETDEFLLRVTKITSRIGVP